MLFNEPKLLKSREPSGVRPGYLCFSALQRAEIAEIVLGATGARPPVAGFSALQRAEIAEILLHSIVPLYTLFRFSALQRAEIAEIAQRLRQFAAAVGVSVLFNEPKLLKSAAHRRRTPERTVFQCSSTSRNC